MNLDATTSRGLFATATVARMATVGSDARPQLVPVTFALLGDDTLVTAVDHKPKRTTALRRLANIAHNPQVCLLADVYSDDWEQLWWARADGAARVVAAAHELDLRALALDALALRYRQYRQQRPAGDLIVVTVQRWSGWRAS